MKKRNVLVATTLFGAVLTASAAEPAKSFENHHTATGPVLVPAVQKYTARTGKFALPHKFTVNSPNSKVGPVIENLNTVLARFDMKATAAGGATVCRLILTECDTPEHPQGYRLTVESQGIEIAARTETGLFYGVQTLCNLIRNAAATEVEACMINDWPDFNSRGYFFTIRDLSPQDLPRLKRVIDVMAGLKLNWLLIEFAESFPYENNPLTKRKNAFTSGQVRDLVAFCRARHIEITPMLQVWSHALWMTYHPDWEKMREGEPNIAWNNMPCPLNEEARQLTEKAVSEQIAVIRPARFGLMMDEIYLGPFARCPRCRKADPKKLLRDYLKFAENLVYSHGVTAVVCQDSFLNQFSWRHGDWLRGELDKRDIILWWSYLASLPEGQMKVFADAGFRLAGHAIAGNPANLHDTAKLIKKYNGTDCTMPYWYHSQKGTMYNPDQETGNQWGGFVNGCDYMWKLSDIPYAEFPYEGTMEMRRRLYPEKIAVHRSGEFALALPLEKLVNAELSRSPNFPNFRNDAEVGQLQAVLAARPERFRLLVAPGGRYYGIRLAGDAKKTIRIPVGAKAEQLSFLLTAGFPNRQEEFIRDCFNFVETAAITVVYEDKSEVTVPLRYRREIINWNCPFGGIEMHFAVRGVDANGDWYSFGVYELVNPHPERRIECLRFAAREASGISSAMLALSLWKSDKEFAAQNFAPANVAKNGESFDQPRAVEYALDFSKGLGGAHIGGFLNPEAVKMDIVDDPTAPHPGKVLRVWVPAAKPKAAGDFVRVSLNFPYRLPADSKTLTVAYKLSSIAGFSHAQEYLLDGGQNAKYLIRVLHPTAGSWAVDAGVIKSKVAGGMSMSDPVQETRQRWISFFFHEIPEPMEFFFADIGAAKDAYSVKPHWKK